MPRPSYTDWFLRFHAAFTGRPVAEPASGGRATWLAAFADALRADAAREGDVARAAATAHAGTAQDAEADRRLSEALDLLVPDAEEAADEQRRTGESTGEEAHGTTSERPRKESETEQPRRHRFFDGEDH